MTLRKKLLTKRKELSRDYVVESSNLLIKMVLGKIDLSKIKKLHCFLPITNSNEPDMRQFIYHASKLGVEVFTTNPNRPLGGVDLTINNYSLNDDVQFDLIIVPMLGYDPVTKHRLGFGGGFYDRFLATQPNAVSIGVCFKEFAVENLPTESHDRPLQKIFAV